MKSELEDLLCMSKEDSLEVLWIHECQPKSRHVKNLIEEFVVKCRLIISFY